MSLKYRLWLSFAPLLFLLALLGTGAVYSLGVVGNRIDEILRANYKSVEAMHGLNEALERIHAAFPEAMEGIPGARGRYEAAWTSFLKEYDLEKNNVTEAGEAELVARLGEATERYHRLGDEFLASPAGFDRKAAFYGVEGRTGPIQQAFEEVKKQADGIRRLNQESMELASEKARQTAAGARRWAGAGLIVALVATGMLAWRTTRTILRPIEDLTRSAQAVGDGRFDQLVTADTQDEVGELVASFNRMTSQLRDFRQSQATRLQRAQQASQSAIDAFPDPILMIEPGGRVDMANPAARQLLGVTPGGQADPPWQPPESLREPLADALRDRVPFFSRSFDQALTYRSEGGDRVYIPQVLPVRDPHGGTLGAAVVFNDVTQFRLLDEFKSDLVATASHELKTPLAGLQLAVHLLLEEAVGPITEKQTELLIDARDNTERLLKIVEHMLSLARLENRREPLAVRPEDPVGLLRAAVERVQPRVDGMKVSIDVGSAPLPPVAADPQRLGQALDNLLVNAANYTDLGGRITLSARSVDDDRVELAVQDTGVGIPPEYVPHVFDKFFRIPDQSRSQGTGLGLAIVKEIVTAHGGEVECESELGRGSTFRITLPVWKPAGALEAAL
ncbi:HAMP domain-containing sensor histidine kinase [Paludisphaera rhizosphaerae]|uniref:HAMP domain-containing sensor histidine kinase n=1 Tax=Paludisphaera rhizosphaerae TaxID=2711216 RepID=UPI0013ECF66C|nr:ATP-binding protein [Paludisphaera rhizosphaerae]